MQLVQRDAELADRVRHDRERQRGDVGVEEPVEAAADAVVVERRQLLRGQPEQSGGMPGGPLADAVEGLAGDQQVLDEHQQPGGGGDAAAPVLAGQVVAEELLEAEPPEEAVEDRQGGDAAGGQGLSGGVGRLAGSWCGRGAIRPMVRVLIHGSPRRSCRRDGSGGRSAAISADMVVRGGGSSRGQKSSILTYIDTPRRKSRAARLTLRASVASPCGPGRDRTLDIASAWDTAKNGVRNGGVRRPGVAPVPHAPSTREVPFDLTFDQWEGNSEILRARCAEKRFFPHISA